MFSTESRCHTHLPLCFISPFSTILWFLHRTSTPPRCLHSLRASVRYGEAERCSGSVRQDDEKDDGCVRLTRFFDCSPFLSFSPFFSFPLSLYLSPSSPLSVSFALFTSLSLSLFLPLSNLSLSVSLTSYPHCPGNATNHAAAKHGRCGVSSRKGAHDEEVQHLPLGPRGAWRQAPSARIRSRHATVSPRSRDEHTVRELRQHDKGQKGG